MPVEIKELIIRTEIKSAPVHKAPLDDSQIKELKKRLLQKIKEELAQKMKSAGR